jgi:O-antigen/teichoic acid export membrane protein
MLYSIIPCVVILGASFFFSEPVLKIGLIIIAISYGATHFVNYWVGINFLRQNFNVVARGKLIGAIVSPLVIVTAVHWLKVYALLIAPIIVAIILGIYYQKKGPINFCFTHDWKETVRLVKIGIVLQAGGLALWAFRLADRTIIASTLSLEQLGLYTFAILVIMVVLRIPTDFTNVLQPILYKELGRASSAFEGFRDIKRIAVYLALGVAVLIPISQLVFYLVVSLITTQYIGSIPIFYVLSYNLYLASLGTIPNLVLRSSIVNKQKITLYFYSIGLVLNIIFDLLVIKLGYGVVGVAWVTICTQGLVTFILYHFIRGYLFTDTKEFLKFQVRILAPFLLTIPFYFFHNYLNLITSNFWTFTIISLVAQAILWSLVIGICYRAYISISDIKTIIEEINKRQPE